MKKLIAALIMCLSYPSKAAIQFGVGGAILSATLGFDPFVWIIGAFGASIVLVKTEHKSKADDIINAIISVCLAGLVAPWLAQAASEYFSEKVANQGLVYALAFILSAAWPALIRIGLPVLRKKLEG